MTSIHAIELTVHVPFIGNGYEWDTLIVRKDGNEVGKLSSSGTSATLSDAYRAALSWIDLHQNVVVDTTTPSVG